MNLKPSENTKIYGMENFFHELSGLYKLKKLPNKILLSGKKGLGKSTLAYHLINYILSENEDYKYNLENFCIIRTINPINFCKITPIQISI